MTVTTDKGHTVVVLNNNALPIDHQGRSKQGSGTNLPHLSITSWFISSSTGYRTQEFTDLIGKLFVSASHPIQSSSITSIHIQRCWR